MERLTTRNLIDGRGNAVGFDISEIQDAYDKLAVYEDADERGHLVIFPCAIGDRLWEAYDYYPYHEKPPIVREMEVESLNVGMTSGVDQEIYQMVFANSEGFGTVYIDLALIGDTLFFTREEAEEKLREMEKEAK